MRPLVQLAGLAALAVGLCCVESSAQDSSPRQFYSKNWEYNKSGNYHYKIFNYKPNKTDTKYKQQVLVYKPTVTKDYVHWYNPETKSYWARCPTVTHKKHGKEVKAGKDLWSYLPKDKRKDSLDNIKDADFGAVKEESPPLPEAKDDAKIECPPPELPKS